MKGVFVSYDFFEESIFNEILIDMDQSFEKDYNLLEKGLRLEDMPFQKLDKQLQLNVPQDLSSLNIDTGVTNTVIILTDPPVA